jgi:hypothetical protein
MIIESIQNVYSVWSDYTQRAVYKVVLDNKTLKEYTEVIVYDIYDKKGQIQKEEDFQRKLDVKV